MRLRTRHTFSLLTVGLAAGIVAGCSGSSNSPDLPPTPAPQASADAANSDNGTTVSIDVLANDQLDRAGATLVVVAGPTNGSVTLRGQQIDYLPAHGFFGSDRFTYRVTDAAGRSATADVAISSAVAVRLRGHVLASPGTSFAVQASVGALNRTLAATPSAFELDLRSEDPALPPYLEATGGPATAPALQQRYASLLPPIGALQLRAHCTDGVCVVDIDVEPRLLLGALPTAEYGLLRRYASAAELRGPDTRERLLGYVVGDTLADHAALLDRAASGMLRGDIVLTVGDTLQLAESPPALREVERPPVGPGSVVVINRLDLIHRRERLLAEPRWRDNAADAERRLQTGDIVWLEMPDSTRLFSVWWWSGNRLQNQANISGQADPGSALRDLSRRPSDLPVTASAVGDGAIELTPVDAAQSLAIVRDCAADGCATRRTTRLRLHAVLDNYVQVQAFGSNGSDPAEQPLSRTVATLPGRLPIDLPPLPVEALTTLLRSQHDDDTAVFLSDTLTFGIDGRYRMTDLGRTPTSFSTLTGHWSRAPGGAFLILAEDGEAGSSTELRLIAEGAGRSMWLLRRTAPDRPTIVAAIGWLPLPATPPAPLPATPFACSPTADGYAPLPSPPATRPPGDTYRVSADGSAIRYRFDLPPDPVPPTDVFFASSVDAEGALRLEQSSLLSLWLSPQAAVADGTLFRFSEQRRGPPGPPLPATVVEQQLGTMLLMHCASVPGAH